MGVIQTVSGLMHNPLPDDRVGDILRPEGEGNPLVDFSATKRVRMVIKDGVVMDTSYDPKWVNPVPRPSAGGR